MRKKIVMMCLCLCLAMFSVVLPASAAAEFKFYFPMKTQTMTVSLDKLSAYKGSMEYRSFGQLGIELDFKVDSNGVINVSTVKKYLPWIQGVPISINSSIPSKLSNRSGSVDYDIDYGLSIRGFGIYFSDNPRVVANITLVSVNKSKKTAVVKVTGALYHNGPGWKV